MKIRTVMAVLNVSSGRDRDPSLGSRVKRRLEQHGLQANVSTVERGGGMGEIAEAAVREGYDAVVACGGDGTVSAVAGALVDSQCALGIIPAGTLNHFAKDMHIPLDVDEAGDAIATGNVHNVDVAEVNGKIFVNNSSLGLYPMIVRGREHRQRLGHSKWPSFLWSLVRTLRRYPMLSVNLTTGEGDRLSRYTPLVFVGNNQYEMRGFEIGSRHRLDSGQLAVYVAKPGGALALLRVGLAGALGKLRRGVDLDVLCTNALQVDAAAQMIEVAMDGEVTTLQTPLRYRIRPGALKVIAPAAQ